MLMPGAKPRFRRLRSSVEPPAGKEESQPQQQKTQPVLRGSRAYNDKLPVYEVSGDHDATSSSAEHVTDDSWNSACMDEYSYR